MILSRERTIRVIILTIGMVAIILAIRLAEAVGVSNSYRWAFAYLLVRHWWVTFTQIEKETE